MLSGPASAAEVAVSTAGYVFVPVYEVAAAAGPGAEVDRERVVDFLAFREWFVKQDLRADPRHLAVVWVYGDSMEPTLSDGDVVMVDRSKTSLDAEAIYVLRKDSMVLVKRVQAGQGRLLRATSDNPGYAPFEFTSAEIGRDIHVIGRVVWAGKRF